MTPKVHRIGSCCSLAFLIGMAALLSGCTGAPRWGTWSNTPTSAQISAVMGRAEARAAQDEARRAVAAPQQPRAPIVTVSVP